MSMDATPIYSTRHGNAYLGDAADVLPTLETGSVSLCFTSPPFPLRRQKAYGNVPVDDYLDWFLTIAQEIHRVLRDDGSFVTEMGTAWNAGSATQSSMTLELKRRLVRLFHHAQDFHWCNTRSLPSPAEWVCRQRTRCKDSVTPLWWLSKGPNPWADNRAVQRPYARNGRRVRSAEHPSGHRIEASSWQRDNGGAIPPNFFMLPGVACDDYQRSCRAAGVVVHPARQPRQLPEFFIRLLTRPGQLVLDPFGGSATTARVAEDLGRKWQSIEINEEYVTASKLRFESANALANGAKANERRL